MIYDHKHHKRNEMLAHEPLLLRLRKKQDVDGEDRRTSLSEMQGKRQI